MLGMVKALNRGRWDALSMNFRGCSGECNRKLRFYHSGETGDLHTVISHVTGRHDYAQIALIGFSVGGNMVLKYLGEEGPNVHPCITGAVMLSVPCDLASSAIKLSLPANRVYLKRFLRMLRRKIRLKMHLMPGSISDDGYGTIKTFKEFDDRYTARIFGFRDAEDYWQKASSRPYVPRITIPTLLITSTDDPFLAGPCYPFEEAQASASFYLEAPKHGGHVGFLSLNHRGEYWSESRTVAFLNDR
jgi:predicted alpha/beta-fold hydrolase